LTGNSVAAINYFNRLVSEKCDFDWEHELKRRTAELLRAVEDTMLFRSEIASIVRTTRELLKLPAFGPEVQFNL